MCAIREYTRHERSLRSGGRGIRTREGVTPLHALQACPFVRSGRPPRTSLARDGNGPGLREPGPVAIRAEAA